MSFNRPGDQPREPPIEVVQRLKKNCEHSGPVMGYDVWNMISELLDEVENHRAVRRKLQDVVGDWRTDEG